MTGIFVTATGTEVGKTYVSEALIRYAKSQNALILPSKPVISGWLPDDIEQSDTGRLLKAADLIVNEGNIEAISPWRLTLPLTPDMAAMKENKEINIQELIHFCEQRTLFAKNKGAKHLIEGVGGLMSPIKGRFTNLEWLKALNYRCILVTGSYLGTLSHTLTALRVLQNEGILIAALVVNETPKSSVFLTDTVDYLRTDGAYPVIEIPWQPTAPSIHHLSPLYEVL